MFEVNIVCGFNIIAVVIWFVLPDEGDIVMINGVNYSVIKGRVFTIGNATQTVTINVIVD